MKKLSKNANGRFAKLRQCYVYEIRVDGVVRYIGKGCNDRVYSHLIEAKRTAGRRQGSKSVSAFSENASPRRSARCNHHREDNKLQAHRR
jgi:hypothetical protein